MTWSGQLFAIDFRAVCGSTRWETTTMFRILCLDGGGIKGVFTAAALARIEDQTKKNVKLHGPR